MDIEPPHHITYVLCLSRPDMSLKSTKDWRDGRLAVMMSGESEGCPYHFDNARRSAHPRRASDAGRNGVEEP
jgi:hypothetical protein